MTILVDLQAGPARWLRRQALDRSCSHAALMPAPSRRSWPKRARSMPAEPWSACLRSLMSAPAKPNSRMRSPILTQAACLTSTDCASALRPIGPRSRRLPSRLCHLPPMMSWPPSVRRTRPLCAREAWHEGDRSDRRRPRRDARCHRPSCSLLNHPRDMALLKKSTSCFPMGSLSPSDAYLDRKSTIAQLCICADPRRAKKCLRTGRLEKDHHDATGRRFTF